MALKKIRLERLISLLKQNTTLTEVLECLEEKSLLASEPINSNVIYLAPERTKNTVKLNT